MNLIKSTFIVGTEGIPEPSSVKIDSNDVSWVQEAIEHAMAVSKDVPTIKEALSGIENHNWSSAIDTELAQIEKLVAKGSKQQFGVDYTKTFAPMVHAATLQILLSIAALHGAIIKQADADVAMFYKVNGDEFTMVAVATDDFTIIGDSTDATSLIKKQLGERFEIVDLGPINWLLRVSLSHDLNACTIALSQQAYV
ncbi:hypothetical protein C0995_014896 [Termitomyces sp. Mi166|nr:hypothetical protein C0995_014896 [Termitomyces sp. Mi166\